MNIFVFFYKICVCHTAEISSHLADDSEQHLLARMLSICFCEECSDSPTLNFACLWVGHLSVVNFYPLAGTFATSLHKFCAGWFLNAGGDQGEKLRSFWFLGLMMWLVPRIALITISPWLNA